MNERLNPGNPLSLCCSYRQQLQAPEDIEGGADRRCTDVLFMVVLLLAWAGMTGLGYDGIANGDPRVLLNGIDYDGRICGVDTDVQDKSKVNVTRV